MNELGFSSVGWNSVAVGPGSPTPQLSAQGSEEMSTV